MRIMCLRMIFGLIFSTAHYLWMNETTFILFHIILSQLLLSVEPCSNIFLILVFVVIIMFGLDVCTEIMGFMMSVGFIVVKIPQRKSEQKKMCNFKRDEKYSIINDFNFYSRNSVGTASIAKVAFMKLHCIYILQFIAMHSLLAWLK